MRKSFCSLIVFTTSLALSGCFQTYNSTSKDKEIYENPPDPNNAEGWATSSLPARTILMNSCASCHNFDASNPHHEEWGGYKEADFVDNGLIVPGDPDQSQIWAQLDAGLMPKSPMAPLTAEQKETIRTWIMNYGMEDATQ